jgi:hypothetical protein
MQITSTYEVRHISGGGYWPARSDQMPFARMRGREPQNEYTVMSR